MEDVIAAKRQAYKAWKTGKGTRAAYHAAKCIARRAVHHARQEADKEVYKNIDSKPRFHVAFKMQIKPYATAISEIKCKNAFHVRQLI